MSIVENSYPNKDLQSTPLELLLFQEAVELAEIVLSCNSLIMSAPPHGKQNLDDGVVWNVHFPFVKPASESLNWFRIFF